MTPILVDTGFLVALFRPKDRLAEAAARYLRDHRHPLATAGATVVEACFFLDARGKADLLGWISRGGVAIADVPVAAYPAIAHTLRTFADRDLDFVDAALVWLANETGARRILIADRSDFDALRLKGGRRFELIDWF